MGPKTSHENILARVDRFEANILAAFRDLASPKEIRDPSVAIILKEFYERRAVAEREISELERKRAS